MPQRKKTDNTTSQHPITQREIAIQLGLHQTAVSFALRGDPSISPETRKRVLDMAEKLGYDPERSHSARMMQQRRFNSSLQHKVIALLRSSGLNRDPYELDLFLGIEKIVQQEGYDLILCNFPAGPWDHSEPSLSLKRGYVDGILFTTHSDGISEHIRKIKSIPALKNHPIVTYLQNIPGCSSVVADEEDGSYQAMKHLLDNGHRNILMFQPLYSEYIWNKRWNGVSRAFNEKGLNSSDFVKILELNYGWLDVEINPDTLLQLTEYSNNSSTKVLLPDYLKQHTDITAIQAWNDSSAIHAWNQLEAAGMRVPEDISIIGFDDTHPYPATHDNRLTSVKQPFELMGAETVKLMLKHLRDGVYSPEHVVLPCELVVRSSTAPPTKKYI
ncbi:MAG: LacI family DNA-binding transcriptional regulator [bacterium]